MTKKGSWPICVPFGISKSERFAQFLNQWHSLPARCHRQVVSRLHHLAAEAVHERVIPWKPERRLLACALNVLPIRLGYLLLGRPDLVVLSFIVHFCTWPLAYAFGLFFEPPWLALTIGLTTGIAVTSAYWCHSSPDPLSIMPPDPVRLYGQPNRPECEYAPVRE